MKTKVVSTNMSIKLISKPVFGQNVNILSSCAKSVLNNDPVSCYIKNADLKLKVVAVLRVCSILGYICY